MSDQTDRIQDAVSSIKEKGAGGILFAIAKIFKGIADKIPFLTKLDPKLQRSFAGMSFGLALFSLYLAWNRSTLGWSLNIVAVILCGLAYLKHGDIEHDKVGPVPLVHVATISICLTAVVVVIGICKLCFGPSGDEAALYEALDAAADAYGY